jgi:hypothetical protein
VIGAMAKSSQVGLHVWLPMAMEGPTPVSALIHAATMVTAGVYLLIRSSPLIEYSSTILLICLWLGAITTVFSSLVGLFQQDIKKVIAYSTMSQLGMMVIAIGLSSYNVALFHLVNHAFYKGLLFLGAGAVIHAVADNQDFRRYGGLISFLPLTYSVILIASLSLVAFPFMTGFYSKDFILESAFGQFYFSSIAVYVIATIGAIFTTLYSVKVLYLTFLTNPNGSMAYYRHAHEGDLFLSLPLVVLAIFSIFFGYITKDLFIGLGSSFFIDNSIFIHPAHEIMLDTEFAVPTLFKLLPFIFTVSFSGLAIIYSEFLSESVINFKLSKLGYNIFGFFNQRFLVEMYYNKYITGLVLNLGGQTTKVLDKGAIEMLGPYGLETVLIKFSKSLTSLNTGFVTTYAMYIIIGIISYLSIASFMTTNFNLILLIIVVALALIGLDSKPTTKNNLISASIPSTPKESFSKESSPVPSLTTSDDSPPRPLPLPGQTPSPTDPRYFWKTDSDEVIVDKFLSREFKLDMIAETTQENYDSILEEIQPYIDNNNFKDAAHTIRGYLNVPYVRFTDSSCKEIDYITGSYREAIWDFIGSDGSAAKKADSIGYRCNEAHLNAIDAVCKCLKDYDFHGAMRIINSFDFESYQSPILEAVKSKSPSPETSTLPGSVPEASNSAPVSLDAANSSIANSNLTKKHERSISMEEANKPVPKKSKILEALEALKKGSDPGSGNSDSGSTGPGNNSGSSGSTSLKLIEILEKVKPYFQFLSEIIKFLMEIWLIH